MKEFFISTILFFSTFLFSCHKEKISSGNLISDFFYLENKGAKMPVLVEGNIDSEVILIFVHGGPGGTAIGYENTPDISRLLESKYAIAYHDQRAAGISQGSNTEKLSVDLYADDLLKLIYVLKKRYGDTKKIFLLSHSWGGLVAPAFLTKGNNQNLISGWINLAGAHNFHLNSALTRQYLLDYGKDQIMKKSFVEEWMRIVKFAEENPVNDTFKNWLDYNMCASEVEAYIPDIKQSNSESEYTFWKPKPAYNLMSSLSNLGSTYVQSLTKDILTISYSEMLSQIRVPVINITGKYDFTVPSGLAKEVMQKIGSVDKSIIIMPNSGHLLMHQEPDALWGETIKFVEKYK